MTEAVKKGRTSKEDATYAISFIAANDELSSRVPEVAKGINVKTKEGKTVNFDMSSLPAEVLSRLAADGLNKRIAQAVRNSVDDTGTNAIELASEAFKRLVAGEFYSKAESRPGAGRTFNANFWLDVLARTAKLRKRDYTQAQLDGSRAKLMALDAKGRQDLIKKFRNDKFFVLAEKQARAEQARADLKNADDEFDALAD